MTFTDTTTRYMHKRKGFWYYIRRVPKAALHLESGAFVFKSTGIRVAEDPRGIIACTRVREIDTRQSLRWNNFAIGRDPRQRERYEQHVRIAASFGFPYLVESDVAELSDNEFAGRMRVIEANQRKDVISAIMGLVPKPTLKLSSVLEEYVSLNAHRFNSKSPNQLRKWRVARESCLSAFIQVIGHDIDIADIRRAHVISMRDHWNALVGQGKIQIGSANKYLSRLAAICKAVADAYEIDLRSAFDQTFIEGEKTGKRPAFEAEWVQNSLLAEDALHGLNDEARAIVYLMVETGVTVVEACSLDNNTIVLDHKVPHIRIRAAGRQLTTQHCERDIPLVGVALAALQKHPDGFPRYQDKNARASADINKFLRGKFGLATGQTLCSLRHTFKDRLRKVRCHSDVSARLMGREYDMADYGEPSLEEKLNWLVKIAFQPPSSI